MYYLIKKYNNKGIHKFLVNKIYSISNREIHFYIPELCYLVIIRGSPELEKYLIDKTTDDLGMYFYIYWCFDAFSDAVL